MKGIHMADSNETENAGVDYAGQTLTAEKRTGRQCKVIL